MFDRARNSYFQGRRRPDTNRNRGNYRDRTLKVKFNIIKMAHSTRSHGSIPKDTEVETRQKNLEDRKKQAREPSKMPSRERVSDSIDANSLFQVVS